MPTTFGIRLVSCPLCGSTLYRASGIVGGPTMIYQPRAGFDFSWKHFPRGLGEYHEATRFRADVCRNCGDPLAELFEPAIRFIKNREVGR
jgi:hypothetical protein